MATGRSKIEQHPMARQVGLKVRRRENWGRCRLWLKHVLNPAQAGDNVKIGEGLDKAAQVPRAPIGHQLRVEESTVLC